MAIQEESRMILKRTSQTGVVPIQASGNTITDDTTITEILIGEMYANIEDDKVYINTNNGIQEFMLGTGGTVSGDYVPLSGGTLPGTFSLDCDSNNFSILSANTMNLHCNTILSIDADQDIELTAVGDIIINSISGDTKLQTHTTTSDVTLKGDSSLQFGTDNYTKKVIQDIGDWNMDTTSVGDYLHGLSVTEWKTIHSISVIIRNDADTLYTQFMSDNNQVYFDSTKIYMERRGGGQFDSVDYDSTSYNRGIITFWYTVD